MSYKVFARKWRPMKFEDVVSQTHVTTTLRNAIENDRLASAYLFSGPRGVGKTTNARIFAKAINCDKGPTPTPCNTCPSCKDITDSRSLEVFEIDGASNRGIDEVRTLRENLKYSATKGKHKIYIIDEVHMLTTEAFNALLKTLEEPPANVLFIFATTEPHKVPVTILSRCQRYDFHRIPVKEMVQKLQQICQAEKIEIDEEALFLIAQKSEGSLRDSQSLLDQVVSFCGDKIAVSDLADLLGIIDQEFYFECSDCIAKKDVSSGLQLAEKIYNSGFDMAEFLTGLAEHFRNALVMGATNEIALLNGLDNYADRYRSTAQSLSETDLMRLIQLASETVPLVKRGSNPRLALEMAILKMIKMDKSVDIETILIGISNLRASTDQKNDTSSTARDNDAQVKVVSLKQIKPTFGPKEGGARVASVVGTPQQPSPASTEPALLISDTKPAYEIKGVAVPETADESSLVSLQKIKEDWCSIIDEVKNKKIHLGSFLNEGYPTGLNNGILEVSFGKGNGFHINTITQNKKLVQDVIFAKTGFRLTLDCQKNESDEFRQLLVQSKPENDSVEKAQGESENVLQIPIVKKVLDVFDGEIVR